MSGYTVVIAELDAAHRETESVLTALRGGINRSTRSVDRLLADGWSGTAAEAFGTGWTDWHRGARAVADALDRIAVAIERTAAEYRAAEANNVTVFNGVTL